MAPEIKYLGMGSRLHRYFIRVLGGLFLGFALIFLKEGIRLIR